MLDFVTLSILAASLTFFSSLAIFLIVYISIHKKSKRNHSWETSSITNSASISRRTSTSCLGDFEKPIQSYRPRSYSQTSTDPPPLRTTRSSLSANTRFPSPYTAPPISKNPCLTFDIRYENTIEILFIHINQLQDYFPIKNSQAIFLILYLLPNDDEQQQTRSSNTGLFNELFQFPIKSTDLFNRTLRITAYTVDSTTRIRQTLGHVFVKLDQTPKTFSESLVQDPQVRSEYLGELILTNTYLKEQNLLQIRIQQINQLHVNLSQTAVAHFSGQTSSIYQKHQWINTSAFSIPISTTSFRVDQDLNLPARSLILSTNDEHLNCHLRLHIHGIHEIHSHARWQFALQSNSSQTITVPLLAF